MTRADSAPAVLGGWVFCALGGLLLLLSMLAFWVQGGEKERGNCLYATNEEARRHFLAGRLVPEAVQTHRSVLPPGTVAAGRSPTAP